MTDRAPTPLTDALIMSGPFSGPKEFIELWDRATDLCAQLERENAALRARIEALEGLLEQSRAELKQYYDEIGGCDHSVGICCCHLQVLIERIDALKGRT